MSETEAESRYGEEGFDDRLLRERVREKPGPALFWLAGVLLLVALEFGRLMSGLLQFGSMLRFVVSGFATLPGWVGDNVGETLGWFAGTIASDLTALVMLFLFAVILNWLVLPGTLLDRFDLDVSRRARRYLERFVLTAILAFVSFLLVFTPVGTFVQSEITFLTTQLESLSSIQTLTSRETIPNQGHQTPEGGWEGTFLGLSPGWAWAIRVAVIYAYAFFWLFWALRGYDIFREHYREADWTPRDDTLRRFRTHYWGLFGLSIVFMFVVLALWAPSVSPVPAEDNIFTPYGNDFQYLDESGDVVTVSHGVANLDSRSNGQNTVGLLSYDNYDRWAPLGTTPRGQNMMTHLAYGAQTSLIIGVTAIGLAGFIAVMLSLLTAYYKGVADILTVIASDTIISIPALLLVMMLSIIFDQGDHWLAEPLDGAVLLSLIFALVYWPGLWRSIRGPSLQVAEQEWVDAAKSYGQSPLTTMKKHMAPYIAGYIMIYASLLLGGVIIFTAALSFLGLGINPPTPEWGRLIDEGQPYVATSSWHVATVSGLMIVLVVTAFNALGDGLRDAIDPEADVGGTEEGDAAATGGGG